MTTSRDGVSNSYPTRIQPSKRYLSYKNQSGIQRIVSSPPMLARVEKIKEKGGWGKGRDKSGKLDTLDTGRALYPVLRILEDGSCGRFVPEDFTKLLAVPGVYGLVDPLTDHIAYVGRSKHIGNRFKSHVLAPPARLTAKGAQRKNAWIRSVLKSGQAPGVIILSFKNRNDIESRWIAALRRRGWCELNVHD